MQRPGKTERLLRGLGIVSLGGGILLGVPLGILGGYIAVWDSRGVSLAGGIAVGLFIFAVPPLSLGAIFLVLAGHMRTKRLSPPKLY